MKHQNTQNYLTILFQLDSHKHKAVSILKTPLEDMYDSSSIIENKRFKVSILVLLTQKSKGTSLDEQACSIFVKSHVLDGMCVCIVIKKGRISTFVVIIKDVESLIWSDRTVAPCLGQLKMLKIKLRNV